MHVIGEYNSPHQLLAWHDKTETDTGTVLPLLLSAGPSQALWSRIARRALMCSGVVPQQPPMMPTPRSIRASAACA